MMKKNMYSFFFSPPSGCRHLQLPAQDPEVAADNVLQHPGCFGVQCLCPVDVCGSTVEGGSHSQAAAVFGGAGESHGEPPNAAAATAPPKSKRRCSGDCSAGRATGGERRPASNDRAKATVPFLQQENPQHLLQVWTAHLQSPHLHALRHLLALRLGLSNVGFRFITFTLLLFCLFFLNHFFFFIYMFEIQFHQS